MDEMKLPGMLMEAGIATREQASQLLLLLDRELAASVGNEFSGGGYSPSVDELAVRHLPPQE